MHCAVQCSVVVCIVSCVLCLLYYVLCVVCCVFCLCAFRPPSVFSHLIIPRRSLSPHLSLPQQQTARPPSSPSVPTMCLPPPHTQALSPFCGRRGWDRAALGPPLARRQMTFLVKSRVPGTDHHHNIRSRQGNSPSPGEFIPDGSLFLPLRTPRTASKVISRLKSDSWLIEPLLVFRKC